MHILLMPARTPEVNGIWYMNTTNGGVRNVFAQGGLICFVMLYHKNYYYLSNTKIIH